MNIDQKIEIFSAQLQEFITTKEMFTQMISDLGDLIRYCENTRDYINVNNTDGGKNNEDGRNN